VFFDEMDSLFRTRGSGVSSDVETTIVPQLLSEIDGVEGLENVIVIGASNREDMIDPAILRPGRLDVKIKIERPDAEAARDIFAKYLTVDLPLHEDDVASTVAIGRLTVRGHDRCRGERMYAEEEENRFLEVTYAGGDKEILYFKDFNSGAMIQNIVDRAKKNAIKDFLSTGQKGLRVEHLLSVLHRRVPRERGPAQHDQPGRLGAHLRQEGGADRLHPHPHQDQGRHRAWPVDQQRGEHRPISVSDVPVAGLQRGT
jgi:proteasome-associated ATPase